MTATTKERSVDLGVLGRLLRDDAVTDVLVNGDGRVWVDRAGLLQDTGMRLGRAEVELLVERTVTPLGRRADRASPIVDARLADGTRFHAVVPPIAADGPIVSLRRFTARPLPLESWCGAGVAELLRSCVREGRNIVVSGGTGAGKTTLLNSLAGAVPPGARIVTIEDALELQLDAPHVVRLEARPANAEGAGEVLMRDLVRCALRLRPDRLVVGEVRGPEAADLAQAMNTGHAGSLSTVHANSPVDAVRRLEALVLSAGTGLPHRAVRQQLVSAVDVVVQVERRRDRRTVTAVAELDPAPSDPPVLHLLADEAGVLAAPPSAVEARMIAALLSLLVAATVAAGLSAADVGRDLAVRRRLPARPAVALLPGSWRRRARDRAVDRGLPAVLEATAAGLRSGATLPQALAAAGNGTDPVLAADLGALLADAAVGGLGAAADAWPDRRPTPGVRLASAAIALAASLGGAGARALDGVARTIRQRHEAAAEVRALSTQARLSAVILAAAPLAFAALAATADPRTLGFLIGDAAGRTCLVGGLVLEVAGAAWMSRITREAAR